MMTLSIIGNLGSDAQTRITKDGREIMTFSVGCSQKDSTIWVGVVANKMNGIYPYLLKGRQVYVSGSVRFGEYEKKSTIDISANVIALCGKKNDDDDQTEGSDNNSSEEPNKESNTY